jgi:GTP1/Obg family GTP-binding protein
VILCHILDAMQLIDSLAEVQSAVVFLGDLSGSSLSLANQVHVFESLRPKFTRSCFVVAINRTDGDRFDSFGVKVLGFYLPFDF